LRVTTLRDIAFFLNSVTPDMTPAEWEKFLATTEKRRGLAGLFVVYSVNLGGKSKRVDRMTLAEAQGLRVEIARDLTYRDKHPDMPFASLFGSLNRLELKTEYSCIRLRLYGKPLPGQVILKVGKNRFVPRIRPKATTPKELLYVTLGAALMNSTLARLKKCLQCGKWIVGKNSGKKFCPSGCKDVFHYNARINSGYFKQYQQERRAHGL
jgi:hypothetical protein